MVGTSWTWAASLRVARRSQTSRANISKATGAMNASERMDALVAQGGIQVCGNAQNCEKVCPKAIPLLTAIGRGGRAATLHILRKWFDR